MRTPWIVLALTAAAPAARADVGAPSTWPAWQGGKLGVHLKHPPGAKVTAKGGTIELAGADLPRVTITVAPSDDRGTARSGGVSGTHVEYTIDVPKRHATCTADADDKDKADVASWICDSIELDPGPRHPHVELNVSSSGLADDAAFDKAVRGRQRALDACWQKALGKDRALPEGSITLERTYDHGKPAQLTQHAENFFDHDAKAFAACVLAIVKAVPARTAADEAQTKIEVIGQYY